MSYLTFDIGTTSVKLCLFDKELRLVDHVTVEYTLKTHNNYVEADPAIYRDAILQGVGKLGDLSHVLAICTTTQGETMIPVDDRGEPLQDAIVWLDGRADAQAACLSQRFDSQYFYEQTGIPEISGALPLAKLLWLKECRPAIFARTKKLLLLEDYILYWLTGQFVTEKSLQCSSGWFNIHTDDYWTEALEAVGVDRALLPKLLECGTVIGEILPETAAMLGLSPKTAVITGAMDQVAAALAANSAAPGCVCETTGTAMVAAAFTDAPQFRKEHHVTVYRGPKAGSYLYLPISNTAGMSLKWFQSVFFPSLSDHENSYALLDQLAAQAPPGASGLIFLPYLAGSTDPVFLPDATGCFFHIRVSSKREDFVRAVLESVAYQLREFLEMLERLGYHTGKICSLGGGALSPLWLQIKSDVCGCSLYTLECCQATSLGAAILAASALTPDTPVKVKTQTHYVPEADNRSAYDAQYRNYRRLAKTLEPLYGNQKG